MSEKTEQSYITIDPKEASVREVHQLLLGGVAPRPIALVSTISKDGINNLSPFSFFNAFGANPPTIVFSPSRRGRDATTKDTLNNLKEIPECVIQAVSFDMVEQVSLASTEYESDIDEFIKSGLTPVDSDIVKPKRVKESKFQMECKVKQIIPVGEDRSSANLVICEVVKFHIDESIFKDNIIQPDLIDLVGRNSGNFYTRASKDAIFEIEKPIATKGIGIDQLPEFIKSSDILTANNLGQLGNVESLPDKNEIETFLHSFEKIPVSPDEIMKTFNENDYQKLYICGYSLAESDVEKSKELIEISAFKALEKRDRVFALNALLSIPIIFESKE